MSDSIKSSDLTSVITVQPTPAEECCQASMRDHPLANQELPQSRWQLTKDVMKLCCLVCYTACPPVPELVARKVAFHPPKRGNSYRLCVKGQANEIIHNAEKVGDRNFDVLLDAITPQDQVELDATSKRRQMFVMKTARGNHLVCVRCTPDAYDPMARDQVILFVQPNASDLRGFLHSKCVNFPAMAQMFGCDVFGFDYSGFGCSTGSPSEMNIYSDVDALYDHILRTHPEKKIVLLGYSIGTTAAVHLAAMSPPKLSGVILIAPLASALRLLADQAQREQPCCLDRFRSVDKIANIDVPVLICHGKDDLVIPVAHAMALHSRLRHPVPPLLVAGADHLSILTARIITFRRIAVFIGYETYADPSVVDSEPEVLDVTL